MIDASKSPVPAWKRYLTIALLAVLVLAAAYVIYTKEIHHSSPSPASPAPAASQAQPAPRPTQTKTAPTTIPGGIPISSRNPFQ